MKRLFNHLILALLGCFTFAIDANGQQKSYDWTFIYWMPYDNDLTNWADSIHSMIISGLESPNVLVAIQKDQEGNKGMSRTFITSEGSKNTQLSSENSTDAKEFLSYLNWVLDNSSSDKYAIIFLDHGGKLDEVGLDENTGNWTEGFMRIDSIRWAMESFNRRIGNSVDLTYLQVCTKGSIEPLYELREVSKYTLVSQNTLGAPNFYYEKFFSNDQLLSTLSSGLDIARGIVATERTDMYNSLTCIDNSAFSDFEKSFKDFLFEEKQFERFNLDKILLLNYAGQSYWDLYSYLNALESPFTSKVKEALSNLIVFHSINPELDGMKGYGGVSLMALNTSYPAAIKKYSHLSFFQAFNMSKLYKLTYEAYQKSKN